MKSITKLLTSTAIVIAMLCFNSSISYSQTTRDAGTGTELTNAVTASVDGDIINITNNIVISAEIAISKTLTLNGNNFTISVPVPGLNDEGIFATSPSAFRVFTITGATKTIIINNMTIKGGANVIGAGININSATVKLNNVIICNCYAGSTNGGGGIYNGSGKLFCNNVQLMRNAARYGGGFVNASGTMYIENSSFSENRSTGTSGGGGGGENNGTGIIYMNNSTFSNNKSTEIGGGINNYRGTLWLANSTFTGNVGYGSLTCGGAIGVNGGTANIVNCIFTYNYIRSVGDYTNPTSYTLDDVSKYSGNGTINSYYNIFHSTVSTDVSVSNIAFTGNANGSDNSIFSNGLFTEITDGTGAVLGTGKVFQPFLISQGNTAAITLQTSSFALQPANMGARTGFTNDNGTAPVVGYYNGASWVTLAGSNAQNYIVTTDQAGTTRANPPARGSVEVIVDNVYMLKVNKSANGTVSGGSLYGDVYTSGTNVSIIAIPNSGYAFTRWDYVVGGSGTASTSNPYQVLVDRNITLIPVFASAGAGNYSITYIGNGNTGGTVPAIGNYSSPTTIAAQGDMVNTGYAFSSWNTNSNGSGTNYNPGAAYSSGINLTLYANWVPSYIWTAGAHNDNWNNTANWSGNVVPNSNTDASIPSNPAGGNYFPSVNITNASCKSLTVAVGASITVPTGNTLTVYGNMANSGSSQLGSGTISFNGASAQTISGTNVFANLKINNSNGVSLSGNTQITDILTTTTGTLTTNNYLTLLSTASKTAIISGTGSGNVSGNVNVKRYFGSVTGYYYLSSPVTGTFQQVANNMAVVGWGTEYKSGGWSNLWRYDETDISQITHPDGVRMNGWRTPANSSVALTQMEGIAIYSDANKTFTFTGSINNGPISIPLTNTSSVSAGGSTFDDGWNLVGNPYPCPINWDAASGWTKTNVANSIYFYSASGEYKTYINGIGTPSGVNGIIAPGQGFFIKAFSNGTLGVTNAVRVDNTTSTFYKKDNTAQMIRLKGYYTSTPDFSDETVVYFDANARTNYDPSLDAYKLMNTNESYPNIYTIKSSNDKMSINSHPVIGEEEVTIPLALNVKQTGSFVINATEIINLASEIQVYLVDNVLNKMQNLNDNPEYKFNADAKVTEGRFFLKINPKNSKTGIESQSYNTLFYAYAADKILNVSYNSTLNTAATLDIYNLLGQTVISSAKINNGKHIFKLEKGIYIIRCITDYKTYTEKVYIY